MNPLAALLDCTPGFNTNQLKELLHYLKAPELVKVQVLAVPEAVEVRQPGIKNVL